MATNNKNFVIKNGVEVNNDSFFTNADVTFYGATSGRDIIFRNSDNQLRFKDNVKAVFGTDGHFQIFHNSSAAWIQNYTGNMEFQTPSGSTFDFNRRIRALDGINVTGSVFADGLSLGDDEIANFGDGNDLQIYHESTFNNSVIKESGSGNLLFGGKNIDFRDAGLGDSYAIFRDDSTNTNVELYYNGSKTFETTSTGIDVTGTITADGLDMEDSQKILLGNDDDFEIYHDGSSYIKSTNAASNLFINSAFGLQLRVNSSHAALAAISGAQVELFHANDKKFETTSTGIDVTGNNIKLLGPTSGSTYTTSTLTLRGFRQSATGEFANVDFSNIDANSSNTEYIGARISGQLGTNTDGGELKFFVTPASSTTLNTTPSLILHDDSSAEFAGVVSATSLSTGAAGTGINISTNTITGPSTITIDPAAIGDNTGLVIIKGDFQIDGTTTTVNSTAMTVDDLNIKLAHGAANSAAANGAGITIDGASESLTWVDANKSFRLSTRLGIGAGVSQQANLRLAKDMGGTGGSTYYGILNNGKVQPDVTSNAYYNYVQLKTDGNSGTAYTISNVEGYTAAIGNSTINADSTITNLTAFSVKSNWTEGTNNYGFRGNIDTAANTNRWNVYMDGSAPNYFNGRVGIGTNTPRGELDIYQPSGQATTVFIEGGSPELWFKDVDETSIFRQIINANGWIVQPGTGSVASPTWGDVALTVSGNGYIGVNTNTPSERFHIYGGNSSVTALIETTSSESPAVVYLKAGSGRIDFGEHNSGNIQGRILYANAANSISGAPGNRMLFFTNNDMSNVAMSISNAGSIGIGTDNPTNALHIETTGPVIRMTDSNAATNAKNWNIAANSANLLRFQAINDDGTSGGGNLFDFKRSGNSINDFLGMSAGSYWFTIQNNNKRVGIGTDAPETDLEVTGSSVVAKILNTNDGGNQGALLLSNKYDRDIGIRFATGSGGASQTTRWTIWNDKATGGNNNRFNISPGAGNAANGITILQNNNVGIGNGAPTAKLDVSGSVNIASGELNFTGVAAKFIDFYTDDDAGNTYKAEFRLVNAGNTTFDVAIGMYRDGEVALYYDNSRKFETTNTGAKVTGQLEFGDGTGAGGTNKISFGASDDLNIFHDGSNSYIKETGTGHLILMGASDIKLMHPSSGDTYAIFNADGASELYHDNSKTLETTSNGVSITGSLTTSTGLIAQSLNISAGAPLIKLSETGVTGNPAFWIVQDSGNFSLRLNNNVPYPFRIITKGTNKDAIDFIDFGGETSQDVVRITSASGAATYLDIKSNADNLNSRIRFFENTSEKWNFGYNTNSNRMDLTQGGSHNVFALTDTHKVGINRANPTESLDVNGVAMASLLVDSVYARETWPAGNNTLAGNDLGTWTLTGGTLDTPTSSSDYHMVDKANLPYGLNAITWNGNSATSYLTSPNININILIRANTGIFGGIGGYLSNTDRSIADSRIYLTVFLAAQSMDSSAEYLEVELSNNGGTTWAPDIAFVSQDSDQDTDDITDTYWRKVVIDISEYSSSSFRIRFKGTGTGGGDGYGVSNLYIHEAPIPNRLQAKTLKLGGGTIENSTYEHSDALTLISSNGNSKLIALEDEDNLRQNYIGIKGSDSLEFAADEDNLGDDSGFYWRIDAKERMRLYTDGTQSSSNVIMHLTGHTSDKSNWRLYVDDNSTNGRFRIQDYSGAAWTSNLTILNDGNVGIGTESPSVKLEVAGHVKIDSGPVLENSGSGDSLQITTPSGYCTIGSNNTSYAHFYTDRDRFYFNKKLIVDSGIFAAYNEDLHLATNASGSDIRLTILNSNGDVGIGTDAPGHKLHVVQESTDTYGTGIARFTYIDTDAADNMGSATTYFDAQFKTGHSYFKSFITGNSSDFLIVDQDNSNTRAAFEVQGNAGSNKVLYAASSGLVGIGTNVPSRALHVNSGTTNACARFESSDGTVVLEMLDSATSTSSNHPVAMSRNGDDLRLWANNKVGVYISTSQYVGIGPSNTSPSTVLDVEGANHPDPLHVVRGGTITSDQVSMKFEATNNRWFGKGTDNDPYWSTTNNVSTGENLFQVVKDVSLGSSDDLDTLSDGWYTWVNNQPTGSPGKTYMGMLQLSDANQKIQLAFGSSQNGRLFVRRDDSGSWYTWTEFARLNATSNFTTTPQINGNDILSTATGLSTNPSGTIYWSSNSLTSFDPPGGGTGTDTATDAVLGLASGNRIVGWHNGYIRSLLEWNQGSDITIGQGGTTLIGGIDLLPGNSGVAKVNGVEILTKNSVGEINNVTHTSDGQYDITLFGTAGGAAQSGNFSSKLVLKGGGGQTRTLELFQDYNGYATINTSWVDNYLDITGFNRVRFNQFITTSGNVESGRGSGGVALTINDGYGNANVTWNHANGVPEQNGNAGRIQVNTDATSNASMYFGLKSNVSANTAVQTTTVLTLTESGATVNGLLSATTKSFIIDHPTKEGMKLRHGSLEGPENGVYVRGRLKGNNTIELPDYWTGLVDEDTITVNLTAIGSESSLHKVVDIYDNTVVVDSEDGNINCFYTVFGERKDVEKMEVEY